MDRLQFIKIMSLLPLLSNARGFEQLLKRPGLLKESNRMPVIFTAHSDLGDKPHLTPFTSSLRAMGAAVNPSVILIISGHFLSEEESFVTVNKTFSTPEYPSKGSPEIAKLLIDQDNIQPTEWDLDHGAWSVLRHLSPKADVPILELSIAMNQPLDYHYKLARQLAPLRDMGVLVVGSGNIVHNLELTALKVWSKKPYEWALEFDTWAKEKIDDRDLNSLFHYQNMGSAARWSVPTSDHYIPLLYALSLANQNDPIVHTYQEVFKGMSFRCIQIG